MSNVPVVRRKLNSMEFELNGNLSISTYKKEYTYNLKT